MYSNSYTSKFVLCLFRALEKDISELKREIRGRDDAVAEREKRIAHLRMGALDLEKNRPVYTNLTSFFLISLCSVFALPGQFNIKTSF